MLTVESQASTSLKDIFPCEKVATSTLGDQGVVGAKHSENNL
ncbi:MAG: hypothetical protein ACKPEO_04885 [Sphaerospermopsis kisseleviana]